MQLKEKPRQHANSYNSRALKQTYQVVVKIARTAPHMMEWFTQHTEERVTRGALPLTATTELWVAAVSTFGALYEVRGNFVYSKDEILSIQKTTRLK